MNNFTFHNPTKIIFGKGTISQLSTQIPIDSRVLITYGRGSVEANGVMAQVDAALCNHAFVMKAGGIEANPDMDTLLRIAEIAKEHRIDFLLAVGGGSVADGTKFISVAMHHDSDAWQLVVNPSIIRRSTPMAVVITLPATSSEMNHRAVISHRATHKKQGFTSPYMFPVFSIIDPETTYSLPNHQIGCGVVDTFMHVMETYMTRFNQALVMDRWAEGLLQTLIEIGPKLLNDRMNYDLVSNYMLTSTLARNDMLCMGVVEDWATHRIGMELTIYYNLAHAETLAVIYPALLKVLKNHKRERLLQYAHRIWNVPDAIDEDSQINAAINKTEMFFRQMGLRTRLSEYGLTERDADFVYERWKERLISYGEDSRVDAAVGRVILNHCL